MTERKTAEIKFRVAPSEKARWQADAERLETPLSELIRKRMNDAAWDEQNKSLDGTNLVAEAVAANPDVFPIVTELCVCPLEDDCLGDGPSCFAVAASPQEDVSTSDEVEANQSQWRSCGEFGAIADQKPAYPWKFRG